MRSLRLQVPFQKVALQVNSRGGGDTPSDYGKLALCETGPGSGPHTRR